MKSKIFAILALCATMLVVGCSGESARQEVVDPEDGEQIFKGYDETELGSDFVRADFTSSDNYTLTTVEHTTHASSNYCQLRSPKGSLCLIASGAQESCALTGYRIDYNPDGKVKCVTHIGFLDDEEYGKLKGGNDDVEIIKRWMETSRRNDDNNLKFEIERNEEGQVTKVGDLEVPYGFTAKYYLAEWGPFWSNDIFGGCIGFFVELIDEDTEGSSVNYLYMDNHLIAEKAFWKGTFIKARTYNYMGCMVAKYDDREINLLDQTFYDYSEHSKWYVDEDK
ncbi:MAG: hypothetical protein ACI4BH_03645 [Muribaculaceae bacterium]